MAEGGGEDGEGGTGPDRERAAHAVAASRDGPGEGLEVGRFWRGGWWAGVRGKGGGMAGAVPGVSEANPGSARGMGRDGKGVRGGGSPCPDGAFLPRETARPWAGCGRTGSGWGWRSPAAWDCRVDSPGVAVDGKRGGKRGVRAKRLETKFEAGRGGRVGKMLNGRGKPHGEGFQRVDGFAPGRGAGGKTSHTRGVPA